MASSVKNIQLTKFDDLFKSQEERQADQGEQVKILPADQVFPYQRQPYTIDRPTADLVRLMDSVEQFGIMEPMIVRPRKEGGYEIIAGHRRDYCARAVGLDNRPAIVRSYSDEEADILVVDFNINREDLLPSEKARAYELKLDAMKRQAGRPSKNSLQIGENFRGKYSVQILSEQVNDNVTAIQRYIRLNKLIPALVDQVDNGRLKLVAAADFLSHLTEKEQSCLLLVMEQDEAIPSMAQARQMKELSQEGKLEQDQIERIMREEKPLEHKITLDRKWVQKRFPKHMTPRQIKERINKALDLLERMEHQKQGPQR